MILQILDDAFGSLGTSTCVGSPPEVPPPEEGLETGALGPSLGIAVTSSPRRPPRLGERVGFVFAVALHP